MEAYPILEGPLQLLGMKVYACPASSKGSSLFSHLRLVSSRKPLADLKIVPCQIIQVPADGLRDGNLGDDELVDCAQEGL